MKILRKQFPVTLAEAITIHKSQGSTYPIVAVHLNTEHKPKRSALYVAFSRTVSINTLFIIGKFIPPNKIKPESDLFKELNNIKQSKILQLKFEKMLTNSHKLKVIVHNVQSFQKHKMDIISDQNQLHCDILILLETWSLPTDDITIPGFKSIVQIYGSKKRPRKAQGITIFTRKQSKNIRTVKFRKVWEDAQIKSSMQIAVIEIAEYQCNIIAVYKSPKYLTKKCKNLIIESIKNCNKNYSSIVVGDFNIDAHKIPNNVVSRFLISEGFQNELGFNTQSTKYLTNIDWVYSNLDRDKITADVYPIHYSYHNALYIDVDQ